MKKLILIIARLLMSGFGIDIIRSVYERTECRGHLDSVPIGPFSYRPPLISVLIKKISFGSLSLFHVISLLKKKDILTVHERM